MEYDSLKILQIIKKDDVVEFDRLIFKGKNLRLGRFPILSIAYLYDAQGIYSRYQGKLLSPAFSQYTLLDEPEEIYSKFKTVSGKCMRFYLDDIVEPTEMLALLGKSELLSKLWQYAPKSQKIIHNISSIYSINHNVNVEVTENNIVLPKIKGSKARWNKYLYSACFNFSFVIICVALVFIYLLAFGLGTNSFPYVAKDNLEGLSQSSITIVNKNLSVNEDFIATDSSATIIGNGNSITLETLPLFKDFSGKMENLTIYIDLKDKEIFDNSAIILNNSGTIRNVNVVLKGDFYENTQDKDLYLSALVHENTGKIEECSIFTDISFSGDGNGNAYFAGVCSINNGEIRNCSLYKESKIIADTVDICGITAENNNIVENCYSYGYLYQYSDKSFEVESDGETTVYSWNPNVAGIALNNNSTISNCINYATLEIESKANSSHSNLLGGIVCTNSGDIKDSANNGSLIVKTDDFNAYVGGIAAINDRMDGEYGNYVRATISNCSQNSDITVKAGKYLAFAGGIVGENLGSVSYSKAISSFTIEGEQTFAGGLIGAELVNFATNTIYYNYYTYQNAYVKTDTATLPYPIILVESTTTDEYGNKKTSLTPYLAEDKTFYDDKNNVFYGNYNFAYDSVEELRQAEAN